MKNNMLVLLDRPEDIEGRLSELREIAKTHGIRKISLVRVLLPFNSRVRSRVAPHKLDMAAQMSDEAVSRYLSGIAHTLSAEDINVEPIISGIPATDINRFIEKRKFHLIVKIGESSALSRWSAEGLPGIRTVLMK